MVLGELGINIGPIIASAGILGVALGFGAQSLVKDFLSGIFMILEDQYGVGDVVDVGEATGTVEEVGAARHAAARPSRRRLVRPQRRDPAASATRPRGGRLASSTCSVAYNEDLDRVRRIVDEVGARMDSDPAYNGILFGTPTYAGVESVSGDAVFVRVTAKAAPDQQMSAGRALREQLKLAFDKAGVPYPCSSGRTFRAPPRRPRRAARARRRASDAAFDRPRRAGPGRAPTH